jgi:hypothetical protein
MHKRPTGNEVEDRIGDIEGHVVGCSRWARTKKRVEKNLAYKSQQLGGKIRQQEQSSCFCYAKTSCIQASTDTKISEPEAKRSSHPALIKSTRSYI